MAVASILRFKKIILCIYGCSVLLDRVVRHGLPPDASSRMPHLHYKNTNEKPKIPLFVQSLQIKSEQPHFFIWRNCKWSMIKMQIICLLLAFSRRKVDQCSSHSWLSGGRQQCPMGWRHPESATLSPSSNPSDDHLLMQSVSLCLVMGCLHAKPYMWVNKCIHSVQWRAQVYCNIYCTYAHS